VRKGDGRVGRRGERARDSEGRVKRREGRGRTKKNGIGTRRDECDFILFRPCLTASSQV